MRRIATGSNRNPAIDLFGTGKHGFKTGNRSLGNPPSTPGGEWYNSVQEELARAIEGAGIALDADKYNQLLEAIKSIAWGAGKTSAPWAPLASPALTDTPTTPTAADGTNTAQIASTAFVQSAVGGYLSKSVTGGAVTLSDLEASNPVIGFSGTLTSNLVVVVPTTVKRLWAIYNATSGAFTFTVKTATGSGVTVAQGKRNLVYTDGTNVYDGFNDFENIALTGVPTAPTAATGTDTTQVATTAFVNAEIAADRPFEATAANIKMDGAQSVGSLNTVARGDHVHPTDTSRAPLASPSFTGTPTAPTAALGTNTNQLATTAFVNAEIAADVANAVRSQIRITSNTIWTSPVTGTVYVSGCGGGGGGAGAYTSQQLSGGGGGGAGRSVMRQSITVAAGESYAVSIGSGGLAGGAGLVGGVGGNTTIGALLTLEGGGGGAVGTGFNGGGGGSGYPGGGSGNGAYGGGEVGTGGMGASTIFGGGGGGGTGAKAVGQNAYGYGAGGGGGAGNSTAAGGAGAPGLIIIEFN